VGIVAEAVVVAEAPSRRAEALRRIDFNSS
jgi:hypothetical protein